MLLGPVSAAAVTDWGSRMAKISKLKREKRLKKLELLVEGLDGLVIPVLKSVAEIRSNAERETKQQKINLRLI